MFATFEKPYHCFDEVDEKEGCKLLKGRANTICLLMILQKYSDENHILSMPEILEYFMQDFDMKIDRRAVYGGIETLKQLGYQINDYDKCRGYYLATRPLNITDVHVISDAIYSMRSLSQKQTDALIEKLNSILSIHQRANYKKLFVTGMVSKEQTAHILESVSLLDKAIIAKHKVSFFYNKYGLNKKLQRRRKERYIVNPYGMVCENGHYYLICIKEDKDDISYYRIDLMDSIADTLSPTDKHPSASDLAKSRNVVYAFSGRAEKIVLRCRNEVIGGLIDRFGTGPVIKKIDDNFFEARLTAVPTGVMYWTMQYLSQVEILEPESMRQQAIALIKSNPYGV